MDEILSSIRQIIADDDEAATLKDQAPTAKPTVVAPRPAAVAAPKPVAREPEPRPEPVQAFQAKPAAAPAPVAQDVIDPFSDDDEDEIVPLALSPEQIVPDESDDLSADDFSVPEPEMPAPEAFAPAPELVVPDDVAFEQDEDVPPASAPKASAEPRVRENSFATAAPMPDATLSEDIAEQLLEPATSAAVKDAFSRLNAPKLSPAMPVGAGGLTIENMLREMLRPMLKEWLDENLPAMVERIVAQEIERVSRGGN